VDQWYRPNDGMTFARSDSITLAGTDLSPAELENIQTQPQEMNRAELKEFIERLRLAGSLTLKWEVERLSKVALPAAAMIIVLFGAPLAAIRRRGGTALGFGLALFVCFIYFAFMEIGKTMGNNGTVLPVIAVWMSNGFFGLLGLASLAYSRH